MVAPRSTINNAIPTRIRSAPTAAGITIGKAPSGRETGMLARAASSVASDYIAHHHEGSMQGHRSRSSPHRFAGGARAHSKPPQWPFKWQKSTGEGTPSVAASGGLETAPYASRLQPIVSAAPKGGGRGGTFLRRLSSCPRQPSEVMPYGFCCSHHGLVGSWISRSFRNIEIGALHCATVPR